MKYILIASNGTEIETTQYNTREEAETAFKEATEMWINKEHPIDDLEYSYIGMQIMPNKQILPQIPQHILHITDSHLDNNLDK